MSLYNTVHTDSFTAIIIIIVITLFNEGKDIDYWSPSSFHNGPYYYVG